MGILIGGLKTQNTSTPFTISKRKSLVGFYRYIAVPEADKTKMTDLVETRRS